MNDNTHVAHVIVSEKPVYIKHIWKENNQDLFHIKVFYENETWSGKFSNEMSADRSRRVDETEEEYANNVLECLNGDSKDYVFDFTRNPEQANLATFIWKRQFDGAVLVHGAVPLERDAVPESKDVLLQFMLTENKRLTKQVQASVIQNNNLTKDLNRYKSEMEDCVQKSCDMYSSLYGKFVQILNTKKRRIQELKELQQP